MIKVTNTNNISPTACRIILSPQLSIATLPGTYRGYAIKALAKLLPIMDNKEKISVQEEMAKVQMPEGDMHYLLERWGSM